jgi:predicted metalloprotease
MGGRVSDADAVYTGSSGAGAGANPYYAINWRRDSGDGPVKGGGRGTGDIIIIVIVIIIIVIMVTLIDTRGSGGETVTKPDGFRRRWRFRVKVTLKVVGQMKFNIRTVEMRVETCKLRVSSYNKCYRY